MLVLLLIACSVSEAPPDVSTVVVETVSRDAEGWIHVTSETAESLGNGPLARLDLTALRATDVATVLASVSTRDLVALRVGPGDLNDAGLRALVNGQDFRPQELYLSGNSLQADALASWVSGGAFQELQHLDLSGNPLADAGVVALTRGPTPALGYLDLGQIGCGDAAAGVLSTWPGAANLETLVLDENAIGPAGAEWIAGAPTWASLRTLHLHGTSDLWQEGDPQTFLGVRGARALAESSSLKGLETLRLPLQAVGDEGATALARSSQLRSLRYLDLRANDIGDVGGRALAASKSLGELETLVLRDNSFSAETALVLTSRFGERVQLD